MEDFYDGYIPTKNKRSLVPFKDISSSNLFSLEEANVYTEYAGILNKHSVLIDIDDQEQSKILLEIVNALSIKCKVIETTRGCHFLFKNNGEFNRNRTHCTLAIGLTADIKGCGKASYQVLKFNGEVRKVVYDSKDYDTVPNWLIPIKSKVEFLNMSNGDGRNSTLFSYILTLQQAGFSMEQCRETITLINKFVLREPLEESELSVVLRETSFEKPIFFGERGNFLFCEFSNFIKNSYNLARINGSLYIYKDGYYQSGDEIIERVMIQHVKNLNQTKRKEVLSYLKLLIEDSSMFSDSTLIAFKNGVLNVVTNELYDFDPKYIITNMIPHNYVPEAECELLDRTMAKLACGDLTIVKLLYQAIGMCMFRKNELRKSFFLLGEKRNGKSTFLDMISTLLGEKNIANLDLSEIGDRFKTAELSGKLANIGDDINDEFISNSAVFKKVVSGDKITVEKKGQDPFVLSSYAKFFFSSNSLPRIGKGKDSAAVLDRLVIIPFDAQFSKADDDYDPYIKYKLREKDVLEALIANSIVGLKEVLEDQQFVTCEKINVNVKEYERTNNPIVSFFEELEEVDYLNQPTKYVYKMYREYCLSNNIQSVSSIEFSRQMKRNFNLDIKEVRIDKVRCRIFIR